jgi:hypothetical protein
MRLVVNSVDIFSAAKIGCFVHLIFGILGAFLFFMLNGLALGLLTDMGFRNTAVGLLGAQCIMLAVGVGFAAFGGAIVWGLVAMIYNIAASIVGGLVLHLSKDGVREPIHEEYTSQYDDKPKREKGAVRREIGSLEQEIREKEQRLKSLRDDMEKRF